MATWAFYSDASLSTLVTEASCTTYPTSTLHLWFGSTTTGVKLEAVSDPGVDPLVLSITDSATGGHAVSAVKLALTTGALSTASGGASLTLASGQIIGGSANAIGFYMSVTDTVGAVAKSTELGLQLTPWVQSAV
jgi:hypothetical protein